MSFFGKNWKHFGSILSPLASLSTPKNDLDRNYAHERNESETHKRGDFHVRAHEHRVGVRDERGERQHETKRRVRDRLLLVERQSDDTLNAFTLII